MAPKPEVEFKSRRGVVYSREVVDSVLDRLMKGETLRQICKDEGLPAAGTVREWVLDDIDGLAERYARARDLGLDAQADELFDIADDGSNDTYRDEDGAVKVDHDVIARSRLRVDTRKWYLSKIAPKKYGDKLDLSVSGEVKTQTDEKLDARLAALVAKLGPGGLGGAGNGGAAG